jgi:hypothetical protein
MTSCVTAHIPYNDVYYYEPKFYPPPPPRVVVIKPKETKTSKEKPKRQINKPDRTKRYNR